MRRRRDHSGTSESGILKAMPLFTIDFCTSPRGSSYNLRHGHQTNDCASGFEKKDQARRGEKPNLVSLFGVGQAGCEADGVENRRQIQSLRE
jgi:hypothetical protein